MKKISSGSIWFTKRVFPIMWFGILAVLTISMLPQVLSGKNPLIILMPVVMTVFGFLLMKFLVWDLVDEVFDCGDHLLVRNKGKDERIMFTNIMNVSASTNQNPPRLTLRLVSPCRFGSHVAFSPISNASFNPFAKNKVAEDLIVRVDAARARRAS